MQRQLFTVFFGGILTAVILFLLGSAALKISIPGTKKPSVTKQYYKEDVFVRPKFLPTPEATATVSALKIPVIMYHYVEYVKDKRDVTRIRLNTNPSELEEQMKELKIAGYDSFFAKDIPDILADRKYYSSHSVVLTFDDGYEDFYTDVLPLLKKYNMRATVYIIYDYIGKKGFLSKSQIRELIASGLVEIGSHTLNHPYLKTMQDKEARRQIFESKALLENDFGITVESFAYPYGALSPQAIDYVKQAKYTNAVSVINGTQQSVDNLFFLSRIRPGMFGMGTVAATIEKLKN